jgi:hypothetical protein
MERKIDSKKLIFFRLVVAFFILLAGEGIRRFFASFKEAPALKAVQEKFLQVDLLKVNRANHVVQLSGFGMFRSREMLTISSEVSGKIIYVNPLLEAGLNLKAGDVIAKIDPRDYALAVELQSERIKVLNAQLIEATSQTSFLENNLKLSESSELLSKNEFSRQAELLKSKVGSMEIKEIKERAYLTSQEKTLLLKQQLISNQNRILTIKQQIEEVTKLKEVDELKLSKCTITSQSPVLTKKRYVEKGQFVSTGNPIADFENDQSYELPISLPGPEALNWLQKNNSNGRLYESLIGASADIYWIENGQSKLLSKGILARVEEYNANSRTLNCVIYPEKLPTEIVTGLFCKAVINGQELEGVFSVPKIAIFKDKLMTIKDGRLSMAPIKILYSQGDFVLIQAQDFPDSISVINSKISSPTVGLKLISAPVVDPSTNE